jgi:DnaA family protein
MERGRFPQIPLPLGASDQPGFELFRGRMNAAVVAEIRRIAAGDSSSNLYLWGEAGSGKTHLLQAGCREAATRGRRAALIPLRQCGELAPEVFESLEGLELICVDDLDAVAGDARWEDAVFHLFNRMREAQCPLVFAARASPAGSGVNLPDLRSRLSWDLVFHLEPLDEAERFAALSQRASRRGMDVPEDVLEFLSRRIARDMHSLFGWLDRLDRESLAAGRKLTVPFVRELVERKEGHL